jgi:hypothetical protein
MTQADQIRQKYNLPAGCPVHSPWGGVDHGKDYGEGIFSVSTPSHGGYRIPAKLNKTIPEVFRVKDGWYEEDCDWAVPVFFLSGRFDAEKVANARKTLRAWRWKQWEEHFGEEIPLEESNNKAAELFLLKHANDLLGGAAWGDWHNNVPEGFVGVSAHRGGDRSRDDGYFLISAKEYVEGEKNPAEKIVIDPTRHAKWIGPNA